MEVLSLEEDYTYSLVLIYSHVATFSFIWILPFSQITVGIQKTRKILMVCIVFGPSQYVFANTPDNQSPVPSHRR